MPRRPTLRSNTHKKELTQGLTGRVLFCLAPSLQARHQGEGSLLLSLTSQFILLFSQGKIITARGGGGSASCVNFIHSSHRVWSH